MRHASYRVREEHLMLMGQAIQETMREMLGDEIFTLEAARAWSTVYNFVSASLLSGMLATRVPELTPQQYTTPAQPECSTGGTPLAAATPKECEGLTAAVEEAISVAFPEQQTPCSAAAATRASAGQLTDLADAAATPPLMVCALRALACDQDDGTSWGKGGKQGPVSDAHSVEPADSTPLSDTVLQTPVNSCPGRAEPPQSAAGEVPALVPDKAKPVVAQPLRPDAAIGTHARVGCSSPLLEAQPSQRSVRAASAYVVDRTKVVAAVPTQHAASSMQIHCPDRAKLVAAAPLQRCGVGTAVHAPEGMKLVAAPSLQQSGSGCTRPTLLQKFWGGRTSK
mmetsp:Transcript_67327/g.156315  ORF Transcript_67327/g.156315 Transcript_67327/m.156315 type:complete len:339 (+) Transcript_67327:3-1019(+)